MKPLVDFGLSQEDERTEAAALALPGGRVLSIASAGDMALSLLALGAESVVAVDVALPQLHLGELKRAAVLALSREEAIRFLGFLPAAPAQGRAWMPAVLAVLPPASRTFWSEASRRAPHGAIWAGRYERYVGVLRALLRPVAGWRFRALLACETVEEQAAVFGRVLDRPLLRAAFAVAFHPRLYVRRGMDPRGLQHRDPGQSLGAQYFHWFRQTCTATPVRENHLLQLHLLGRVREAAAVPAYLTEAGVRAVRERPDAVSFVHASLLDYLAGAPRGRFDRFHLSNVPDWLPFEAFERLLSLIGEKAAPPARLIWRSLHRDYRVPARLRSVITTDPVLGEALRSRDRFPVYRVVPAQVAR